MGIGRTRFLFRDRRVRKATPGMPGRRDPRESRANPDLRVRKANAVNPVLRESKDRRGNPALRGRRELKGNEGNPERHSGLMRPDRWKISHSMMMRLPISASSIPIRDVFT